MGISKLKQIADAERPNQLKKNIYVEKNEYNSSHPNAISDGDDKGRGLNNGNIGNRTDITQRKLQSSKNIYTEKNSYKVDD